MIPFALNIALAAICCIAIAYNFKSVSAKALLITTIALGSTLSLWLITEYAGKPLAMEMPRDIVVYGQAVDVNGGKIYIMYRESDGGFPPKLLETDYSKELSEALKKGRKQGQGKPFRMKTKGGKGEGDGKGKQGSGKDGKKGDGKGHSLSQSPKSYEISGLPPAIMPTK